MAKLDIIPDLTKIKSKRYSKETCRCVVCWKASTVHLPKRITISTDYLQPGELLHMDFYFLDETSIRKLICDLVVIDAKVRKMWKFCSPGKQTPLETAQFLLEQLKQIGRQVRNIQIYLGSELAKLSEFCNLLVEEYQYKLQTTGKYSSWLNGKVP